MENIITILLVINIAFWISLPIAMKLENKYYQGENTILDLIKAIGVFSIPVLNILFLFITIYKWIEETDFWNKEL
jgi:uncharacterized BrkB/YihY/UPF0761 family membrane protein